MCTYDFSVAASEVITRLQGATAKRSGIHIHIDGDRITFSSSPVRQMPPVKVRAQILSTPTGCRLIINNHRRSGAVALWVALISILGTIAILAVVFGIQSPHTSPEGWI